MVYGSVCSGIEAATVAWHPLGWKAAWFSEIETFPNAVLEHHYDVPNLGDMTKIYANPHFKETEIDLLVGGTPCQSFSLAGTRGGLDDPRGDLALEFLRIAKRKQPRWLVWENVPGVLSSSGGKDFGTFLGGLAELGYGFAYRVLDAQNFGVPQTRRRVFVVGHSGGDWQSATKVLFYGENLQGGSSTLKKGSAGQTTAARIGACAKECDRTGKIGSPKSPTIKAGYYKCYNDLENRGCMIVEKKETAIRRLTPEECEKLQGFEPGYTALEGASDGVRYKAVGNSMAVPVVKWIGTRIDETEVANGTVK